MNNSNSNLKSHSKFWLHIWFWSLHISIVLVFITSSGDGDRNPVLILASLFSLAMYCIAVGRFASRIGRSGLLWGGLSLILSPLGVWLSYLASFIIKATQDGRTDSET